MRKIILLAILCSSAHIYASSLREIIMHQIQQRETLFRISLMYNSTINDIVLANPGINPNKVRSGSMIRIPKNTKIRDSVFVAMFLKSPITDKSKQIREIRSENAQALGTDENPFMSATKQVKTIEQMEHEAAPENNVPQAHLKESPPALQPNEPDPTTQQFASESLQSRYLQLKDMAERDKSIKIIDMSRIKITADGSQANK